MIDMERMYKYMDLLERKRYISASEFMTTLEISRATFKRDLAVLRDRFDVPIVHDRDVGAYKLDQTCSKKRLPGIWFSPEEICTIRLLCDKLSEKSSPQIATDFQSLNLKLSKIIGL
jgi:predicted DNA-binding transcriptional regulator YafY